MTTTDVPTTPSRPRLLRRSRTGKVAAGVSSGLGEYFALDPVLFRVLFATSAFFGGAGLLAYLIAWAVIPDADTEHAPIDGWAATLRRHRVPVWAVALAAGAVLWLTAFSWWAPGPFVPVVVVGIIAVALVGRRRTTAALAGPTTGAGTGGSAQADQPVGAEEPTVSLAKDVPAGSGTPASPSWVGDVRAWVGEAKAASRLRARRALPVKLTTLVLLVATLTTLGVIDAVTGVSIQYYFWATLALVVFGLLVGIVLRRTPWSMTALLPIALVGVLAFAGSHARLHDGVGDRTWTPQATRAHYRLAFGHAELDLRQLSTTGSPARFDVTVAAGDVRIVVPSTLRVTVAASVHLGQVDVDGQRSDGGVGIFRTVRPPAGAGGRAVAVDVHLTDGRVQIVRR